MNELIKQQLDKVKLAKLPEYDDLTTSMFIPRGQRLVSVSSNNLQVGNIVVIKLENYIVNPPEGFTLADNWNSGISPKSFYLKGRIQQIIGKMVNFEANGFNINTGNVIDSEYYSQLWLPIKGFKILD